MTRSHLVTLASVAISIATATSWSAENAWRTHGPLKVAENKRFFVHADGTPFFYLGDTAWELFHRLDRAEATRYLGDRASKGFTVIQAVALAELDGLHDPNAYGHCPLVEDDPARPDTKEGLENDYWDHVDFIVNKAEELGLIIGMLPTWGDKWHARQGAPAPIFNVENARGYGEWLGKRYKDKPIIWILGGDRPAQNDAEKDTVRAMAQGLRQGDGGIHLCTFHPPGGAGSSQWFHGDKWLSFNMRQNGHAPEFTGRYDQTRADYDRAPVKPVIDGEPIYEDHPVSFKPKDLGHSVAADVRRTIYWDLFGGACGHTYGHHSVWQMFEPAKRKPINNPLMSWSEALDQPGASQMQYARRLMESRPILTRIPDDTVIVGNGITTSLPGAGTRRFAATRDSEGSYAMVYAPVGRKFKVRMKAITGPKVKAWWFDPRTGEARAAGDYSNEGEREFISPSFGEMVDWVLVLDDASKNFPPPGTRR